MEDVLHVVAGAGQGFIDGVVDELPQAVHQAAAVAESDPPTGAFAYGLEPFEHHQVPCGAVGALLRTAPTAGAGSAVTQCSPGHQR